MAATHGKLANVFALRKNGFQGTGVNDAFWGEGFSGPASAVFEVEIDGVGAPDTFRWRVDGGAWTSGVPITGSPQVLSQGQAITFAGTVGHTVGDRWTMGHLADEPCTLAGKTAQITDPARRLVNPNAAVAFNDSGGARPLRIDYASGRAHFESSPAVVTASGVNGFIPVHALERAGYLYEWRLEANLDLADATVFQQEWKAWRPGQGEAAGSAAGFFAGRRWFEALVESPGALFALQLFTRDPGSLQAGDRFSAWVGFESFNLSAPVAELVKETLAFKAYGMPAFDLGA